MLSSALKNVLTKHFPKMQSFANALQNRRPYKFPDIHKKISVLSFFLIKLQALWPATLLKRDPNTYVFL